MDEPRSTDTASRLGGDRTILLVLLVASALSTLVPRPLFDPDEGRYVAAAVEMIERDDWFTPRLRDDLPHVSKPPLTYWLAAGSMRIFGDHVTAARLPWMLSFLGTALVVGAIARDLRPGHERVAAIIYGTMLLPWTAACVITPDTPLALFEATAILGFVRWIRTDRMRWLWLMWIALGLAALTKGPPGVLPLLPIIAYLALRDRLRLVRLISPLPLLVFLVMSFSWYGAQALHRPDVVEYWLHTEIVGRVASGELERNSDLLGGFRVYLPTLLVGTLPWLVARRRSDRKPWNESDRLFLALWFGAPLLVFLIARSRLPLYVLPLGAPAAIWLSSSIDPVRLTGRRGVLLLTLWVAALVGVATAANVARPDRNGERLAEAILAASGTTPDEIVFVNENPAWSLRFYLDRPVQRVNLFGYEDWGDLAYRPVAKTIEALLAERQVTRVWLLPRHHYVAFRNEMRENGRDVVRLGHYERFVLFTDRPWPLRVSALRQPRVDWIPGITPCVETTVESCRVGKTTLLKEEHRTGARLFGWSRAVGDDRLVARKPRDLARDILQRDLQRARDVPRHETLHVSNVDRDGLSSVEQAFGLGSIDPGNLRNLQL